MLIDLHRIINTLRQNSSRRLLLTGVLASVFLHGLLFDLWRGLPGGSSAPAPAMLNLHLQGARLAEDPPVEQATPVLSSATGQGASVIEPQRTQRRHEPSGSSEQRSAGEEIRAPYQPEITQESVGWRPLSVEEGKVAYRLALLQALRQPHAALPDSGLLLELDLQVGGHAAAVRLSHGNEVSELAQRWLDAVQEAAARVTVPDVLREQARRIELELLP